MTAKKKNKPRKPKTPKTDPAPAPSAADAQDQPEQDVLVNSENQKDADPTPPADDDNTSDKSTDKQAPVLSVKYNGPHDSINVGTFSKEEVHKKGETRSYPAAIAKDLVENSKRNKFEIVK